jgi:hypothetical protein
VSTVKYKYILEHDLDHHPFLLSYDLAPAPPALLYSKNRGALPATQRRKTKSEEKFEALSLSW